jgi:hypothetical protein
MAEKALANSTGKHRPQTSNATLISPSLIPETSQISMTMINKSESSDVTSEDGSYGDDEEGTDDDDIEDAEVSKAATAYTTKGSVVDV